MWYVLNVGVMVNSVDMMLEGALTHYFNALKLTGHVSDCDVKSLLVLSFISEFIYSYRDYISDEDIQNMDKWITCLSGKSCLIVHPGCGFTVIPEEDDREAMRKYRIPEDDYVRILPDGSLRILEN